MATKNVTITFDEDTLTRLRVTAAMRGTTLNGLIREMAANELGDTAHDARNAEWQSFFNKVDKRATEQQRAMPAGLPTKAELNEQNLRDRGLL